ncbi:MAG: dihydrolipoyl dehydrogenase family protein, partial [Steroidobacteraceae bacterium]
QQLRTAARYGLDTSVPAPAADMSRIRDYVRATIRQIYEPTAPEALRARGIAVHIGATRFVDPHTLEAGTDRLRARRILICTGAVPRRPALSGLGDVPYVTYKEIFENDRLPATMAVIGGGPVGCEIAQAYQRLGAKVTLICERLLPGAEPEVSELLAGILTGEGIEHVRARAQAVRRDGACICVSTDHGDVPCELLLLAVGRQPDLGALALEAAGVRYSERGIQVNTNLQTSARHIYAAGDVIGGAQFSHLAGWQAFQAARNALLPGNSPGIPQALPHVTFTVPEVAQIGLTERKARARFGNDVQAQSLDLSRVDRAVSEADPQGLVKLIARRNGRLLGATVMGARAGEALAEISVAMFSRLTLRDLAASIHPYPTYNSAIQLLATQMAVRQAFSGMRGRIIRAMSRWSLRR